MSRRHADGRQFDMFATPPEPPPPTPLEMAIADAPPTGAQSSYIHNLNRLPPPPDHELRREDPTRPSVGDIIKPGAIIRTSYGGAPYLIDRVTPQEVYPGFTAWSITGLQLQPDGTAGRQSSRGWINELVAMWDGDTVTIAKLFVANSDTVTIEQGTGYAVDRRGQAAMVL